VSPTLAGALRFSDGSLRVRYAGWEDAKVLRPGESLELVVRSGQVWAYRRGEPLKGPAPDPYKDWDPAASEIASLRQELSTTGSHLAFVPGAAPPDVRAAKMSARNWLRRALPLTIGLDSSSNQFARP
jgi:hypothetical protein